MGSVFRHSRIFVSRLLPSSPGGDVREIAVGSWRALQDPPGESTFTCRLVETLFLGCIGSRQSLPNSRDPRLSHFQMMSSHRWAQKNRNANCQRKWASPREEAVRSQCGFMTDKHTSDASEHYCVSCFTKTRKRLWVMRTLFFTWINGIYWKLS